MTKKLMDLVLVYSTNKQQKNQMTQKVTDALQYITYIHNHRLVVI